MVQVELNTQLKKRFLSLIKNNKVSHSYIIVGGEGAGKLDLAMYCAKAVLCGGAPCEICDNCRKAESGVHPDIRVINGGEGTTFKIDEVRRVTESINLPPNEGKKKIYILNHCENMTVQAQNALLKAFEEPPEYVLFFILTEKKESLLPTVISRATLFTVHPVEENELHRMLKAKFPKETDENIHNAVRLSEGFFGRAVRFLDKTSKEERKIALQLAESVLGKKSPYETAKILNGYKSKRDSATRLLFLLLYAVRDTVIFKRGGNGLCFLTEEEAGRYSHNSIEKLSLISDSVLDAASALEANGNYTSLVAKLCLDIQ